MHTLAILLTVLESLFAALAEKTLTTDFSVTVGAEQAQPMTYNGSLAMQGECFRVEVLGTEAAYDGKTLYTYQQDADELSLSYPDPIELQQATPFLFARAMQNACSVTEQDTKDAATCLITMTPKAKQAQSEISKILIRVDKSTLLPSTIEVHENRKTTILRAKNPQWTTAPQSWTLDKPGVYINDLR